MLVALDGFTVAVSRAVAPFFTDSLPEDTPEPVIATDVTGTSGFSSAEQVGTTPEMTWPLATAMLEPDAQ